MVGRKGAKREVKRGQDLRRLSVLAMVILIATLAGGRSEAAAPRDDCHGRSDCFVLTSLTIDGVTAYPLKDLAPLYANYLAREISPDDLVRIAQAITDKYRADGYFLSRAIVPPQGKRPGDAQIRVYEGYIGEVDVTGDAAPALESLLAGLKDQRPLKLSNLERRLVLATDIPGVRARSSIEPVLDDPARHRLVVSTGLQKWTASVYADNRALSSLGPVQVNGRVGLNSVALGGDQLALSVLTAPRDPRHFLVGDLSYGAALMHGARVRLDLSASTSQQGVAALNNKVGNDSQSGSLRIAFPLERGRSQSIWTSVIVDARHVSQVYASGGAYDDDLRVVRGVLELDRSHGDSSSTTWVQLSKSLDILGATSGPGPHNSRPDADGRFWKLNAGASHYNDVGAHAGLYVSADAQWSPDPLLLSESFAPGGLPYGRAYNYAEIYGDSGVAGLAEFRLGWDPKIRPLSFFQMYSFVDAAEVWNHRSPYAVASAALASAGGGLRLTFRDQTTLRLEAAKPLTRTPFDTHNKDWRAFISLWAGF